MDTGTEKLLLGKLDDYLKQDPLRTLLVATHKRSVLSLVDRVIVVDQGRIVADGPRDEVVLAQKKNPTPPPRQTSVSTSGNTRALIEELGLPS